MAVAALAAITLVACGGDSKTAPTSTTAAATTTAVPASTSTAPAATTAAPSTSDGESTTTTAPAEPVMPLTGLPITDPAAAARPALAVKIDNHPDARPQTGLNQADIVYEEDVEGITRFAAVFQSEVPDPVGPIRSGRTQDVALLGSLNGPIFAWSGGNGGVTAAIDGSDFTAIRVDANQYKAGAGTYRARDRAAPHNLYSTGTGIYTFAKPGAEPPSQQFRYLAPGAGAGGDTAAGAQVTMEGIAVRWTYDAGSNNYLRFQNGQPHDARDGGQLTAANVVVLDVDYRPSPADPRSPEAQTLGSGAVSVFTGGHVVAGTWTRSDRLQPFALTDASGSPILLTPGRTWVELSKDSATPI